MDGGMIGAKVGKEDVEAEALDALCRQFANKAAIDMAGPIEAGFVIKGAIFEGLDTLIADKYEAEIGGCRKRL